MGNSMYLFFACLLLFSKLLDNNNKPTRIIGECLRIFTVANRLQKANVVFPVNSLPFRAKQIHNVPIELYNISDILGIHYIEYIEYVHRSPNFRFVEKKYFPWEACELLNFQSVLYFDSIQFGFIDYTKCFFLSCNLVFSVPSHDEFWFYFARLTMIEYHMNFKHTNT